jgi:opacity protein-like surface antigen
VASFHLRGGLDVARANSDIFEEATSTFTLDKSDFRAPAFNGELGIRVTDHLDAVLGVGFSRTSQWSEYRHFVDLDDLPIEQVTSLTRVPITASARYYLVPPGRQLGRFAWVPNRLAPYVGGGVGIMWHRFEQEGDFIDFDSDMEVFTTEVSNDGWAPVAHAFGGLELALGSRYALNLDGRYTWANAQMDRAVFRCDAEFGCYDDIDLSGFQLTLGFVIRIEGVQ